MQYAAGVWDFSSSCNLEMTDGLEGELPGTDFTVLVTLFVYHCMNISRVG
jgi:hypothetical protein